MMNFSDAVDILPGNNTPRTLGGLDVLHAMKSDEHTHRIPAVVVTSCKEAPDIQTAYKPDAQSDVVKTVEFDAFLETMNKPGFYRPHLIQEPK